MQSVHIFRYLHDCVILVLLFAIAVMLTGAYFVVRDEKKESHVPVDYRQILISILLTLPFSPVSTRQYLFSVDCLEDKAKQFSAVLCTAAVYSDKHTELVSSSYACTGACLGLVFGFIFFVVVLFVVIFLWG